MVLSIILEGPEKCKFPEGDSQVKQGFFQDFVGCIGNSRPKVREREHFRHQDQQGQRFRAWTNKLHEDQWSSILTNRTEGWKGRLGSHQEWSYKSNQAFGQYSVGNRKPTSGNVLVGDWLLFIFNNVISIIDKMAHTGVRRYLKKGNGVAMN